MQVCSKVPLQHLRDSVCVISTFVVVVVVVLVVVVVVVVAVCLRV